MTTPGWFCLGRYPSCTNRGRPQSVRTGGDLSHLPGQPGLQVAQPEWNLGVWGCHRQAGIWDTHLAGIVQGCAQPQSGLRVWEQQQWVRFRAFHCWCASCAPELGLWALGGCRQVWTRDSQDWAGGKVEQRVGEGWVGIWSTHQAGLVSTLYSMYV